MNLLTLALALVVVGIAIAMFATRILFVKNGEFRGTCASNNPFLKEQGADCPVCGSRPGEDCKKEDETQRAGGSATGLPKP